MDPVVSARFVSGTDALELDTICERAERFEQWDPLATDMAESEGKSLVLSSGSEELQ